jgi:hypothetical protein
MGRLNRVAPFGRFYENRSCVNSCRGAASPALRHRGRHRRGRCNHIRPPGCHQRASGAFRVGGCQRSHRSGRGRLFSPLPLLTGLHAQVRVANGEGGDPPTAKAPAGSSSSGVGPFGLRDGLRDAAHPERLRDAHLPPRARVRHLAATISIPRRGHSFQTRAECGAQRLLVMVSSVRNSRAPAMRAERQRTAEQIASSRRSCATRSSGRRASARAASPRSAQRGRPRRSFRASGCCADHAAAVGQSPSSRRLSVRPGGQRVYGTHCIGPLAKCSVIKIARTLPACRAQALPNERAHAARGMPMQRRPGSLVDQAAASK